MLWVGTCLGHVKENMGAGVASEGTGGGRDELGEVPDASTTALRTGWDPPPESPPPRPPGLVLKVVMSYLFHASYEA